MAGTVNINSITDPLFVTMEGAVITAAGAAAIRDASEEADWLADIAVGVAAAASIYASYAYLSIGRDYYDLYREQRDFYYNNFQVNAESPFAAEVFVEPLYVKDMPGAYSTLFNDMLAYLDPYENWYERKMRMYHMPNFLDTTTHSPQALDRAAHQDDWGNYLSAREKHLEDVYNNRRLSRQLDSLNVGVKQGTAVERGLASSFAVLDDAYGTAGDFFATQANSLGRMSGYFDAREQLDLAEIGSRFINNVPASRGGYIENTTGNMVNSPLGMGERLS